MTADRPRFNMTRKQLLTVGALILIGLIVLWQVLGLFGGGETTPTLGTAPLTPTPSPSMKAPQPAQLIKPQEISPREAELMKLQQETQAKYLAAVNELQMLKLNREIAETNQAIMAARLQTVTSQKQIIDLISPPAPTQVAPASLIQGLTPPAGVVEAAPEPAQPPISRTISSEPTYQVVSVSQVRQRWSAVISHQNNLYNVTVGDVLPPDRSKVISINRNGVVLEKDGVKRKISLVPII